VFLLVLRAAMYLRTSTAISRALPGSFPNVRFWPKADIVSRTAHVCL